MGIVDRVRELVLPGLDSLGLQLWDIEYKKEGSEYYLRIYIDRPEGGVSLDDCESVDRYLSPILDEEDPIPQSYYLEVSSAGLVRQLKTDAHLQRFIGHEIEIHTYKSLDGLPKVFGAVLEGFDEQTVHVCVNVAERKVERTLISKVTIDLL